MSNTRRDALPWCIGASTPDAQKATRFTVGSAVFSGSSRGTVVAVDEAAGVISVEWLDGD